MNKFGKKFSTVIIALGALMGPAAWGQQPLKAAGQDAKPWVLHDKNELSGVAVDLTRAISKQIGVPIDYQTMIFSDLIPAVDSGKIDVIATNMAITPEREQKVDFSRPYYNALPEALVAQSSDATPYRTLADLKGLPVGAQKGSIQLALLQRIGGFSEVKIYDTQKDAWEAVASGQIKATITPGVETHYAAKTGAMPHGARVVDTYKSASPKPRAAFAVRKGNGALLGKINAALATLEADGTLKSIFNKYGLDDWAPPK
ncbi:MAG: ABC transporter substrate-binding protein [Acetobacteraceae bacterium]|jgi:polar amino acid transport system substrate-binding protein